MDKSIIWLDKLFTDLCQPNCNRTTINQEWTFWRIKKVHKNYKWNDWYDCSLYILYISMISYNYCFRAQVAWILPTCLTSTDCPSPFLWMVKSCLMRLFQVWTLNNYSYWYNCLIMINDKLVLVSPEIKGTFKKWDKVTRCTSGLYFESSIFFSKVRMNQLFD